jgi:hypothetical protein
MDAPLITIKRMPARTGSLPSAIRSYTNDMGNLLAEIAFFQHFNSATFGQSLSND